MRLESEVFWSEAFLKDSTALPTELRITMYEDHGGDEGGIESEHDPQKHTRSTAVWELDNIDHREILRSPEFIQEALRELAHGIENSDKQTHEYPPFAGRLFRPPKCDFDCTWNYWKAQCNFLDFCEYRYEFGDVHLSQSCRFKLETDSNAALEVFNGDDVKHEDTTHGYRNENSEQQATQIPSSQQKEVLEGDNTEHVSNQDDKVIDVVEEIRSHHQCPNLDLIREPKRPALSHGRTEGVEMYGERSVGTAQERPRCPVPKRDEALFAADEDRQR